MSKYDFPTQFENRKMKKRKEKKKQKKNKKKKKNEKTNENQTNFTLLAKPLINMVTIFCWNNIKV